MLLSSASDNQQNISKERHAPKTCVFGVFYVSNEKLQFVKMPVPEALHSRMKQLLLQYVVGGMRDAVQTFVDTKQMDKVLRIQRDIVRSYEDDMVKYAERKDES